MSYKHYELEPRILLDAAALVTIGEVNDTKSDASFDDVTDEVDSSKSEVQLSDIEQFASDFSAIDSSSNDDVTQIIFIDSRVADEGYDIDVQDNTLIVILDIEADGIEQISDTLAQYSDLESIHIISHGDDGELLLGNSTLTSDDLSNFQDQIATWQDSTTEGADLLLYGCNVAESEEGEAFVDLFASITGMDVIASDDNTGSSSLGGDWDLEYEVGVVNTQAIVATQNDILLDSGTVTNSEPTVVQSGGTLNEESDLDNPTEQTITSSMLSVTDAESSASDITYTVTTLPTEGAIYLSGNALGLNDTFTQTDIDSGLLTFISSGSEATADNFTYTVADADGGELTAQTFSITLTPYSDPLTIDGSIEVDSSNNADVMVTVTEGGAFTLSNSDLLYSSDSENAITYTVDSLTLTEGTLSLNGVTLSSGDTFTQADVTAGNVTYTHNGDEPTSTQAFTFTVSNGDNSETGTLTIGVTSENDAPAPTGDGLTVDEGGSGNFAGAIIHNDPDNSDVQVTYAVTSLPSEGVLALNGVSISTGTLVSASDLGNLTYTHNGNEISADSFTVSVNDGAGGVVSGYTVDITITPINDQVTIDPINNQVTVDAANTINEGEEYAPITITIGDADDNLSDITVDITSLPDDGILYFDSGNDGIDASDEVTAAMITAGFSITADQTDQLYFSHDGNDDNNGNPDDVSFNITVTDNGGNTGDTTDTTSVTTAVTLTIAQVDDDPTLELNTGTALTIDTANGSSYSETITNTMLLVEDVDSSDTNLVYTLTSIPGDGILIVDGAILGIGGTFSQEDIDNGDVVYTYTGETNGEVSDAFTFTVLDSAYNSDAGRDGGIYDSSDNLVVSTFEITITDTYTTSGETGFYVDSDTIYVDEGSVSNTITNGYLSSFDDVSTDVDLVYTLDSTTTHGTLWLDGDGDGVLDSGEELSASSTFTQQDINDGLLHYDTDGSETASDSFQFDLSDSDGENIDDQTFNIGIRAINDAPVITTNETLILDEGATATITTAQLNVSDVDNDIGALNASEMLITLDTVPANGTLYLNGTALVQYDTFTLQDVIDTLVTFEHNGIEDFESSFDFTVSDGGLTDTGTFNISAIPVNDTPTFADITITLKEGESVTLTALSGSDVDGNNTDDIDNDDLTDPGTDTLSYTIGTLPQYGILTNAGTAVSVGDVFTASELASLVYEHNGDEEYDDSFNVIVNDNTGESNATSTGTVTLQISPINDDPVFDDIDNSGAELHEAQTIVISSGSSGLITDVSGLLSAYDPDSLTEQIQFRITDSVDNGTLELSVNGSWVEIGVGSVFTQDDLDNEYLRYTADSDYQAATGVTVDDSFSFTVSDAGGGDEPTGTFTIDIVPVNDAPEIEVPSTQSTNENTALTFSGLSFDDADVTTSDNVEVTLSIDEGTLTLATTAGLTFISGDGDIDTTMTFTGTLSDVNAAVATLTYTPTDEYAGTTTVSVSINDQGNTGDDPDDLTYLSEYSAGGDGVSGSESASSSFEIEVVAVNEAPTITLASNTAAVDEDDSVIITGTVFADPDSTESGWNSTNELTVTLNVNDGVIALATTSGLSSAVGDGTDTITITGTIDDLNAAVASITYTPDADFDESDALIITINDNGNFGTGGALSTTETIDISVAPVDDDPTINSPTDETINEDASLVFTLDFETVDSGTAADPVPDAFQVTSLPSDGVLYLTNADGSSTGNAVVANTTYTATNTAFIDGEPQLLYVSSSDQNDTSVGAAITFTYGVSDDSGLNYTPDATATISINAANDAPVISVIDAGNDYAEAIDGAGTAVQIVSAITVTDIEIDGNNNEDVDYTNATLTIERNGSAVSSDIYTISGTVASVSGTNVIVDGDTIGTVSGDGTGSLTITFNSSAEQSDVEAVATSITFANDSDAPGDTATIAFIFSDGNDSSEQGSGGSLESTATVEVSIIKSNDAPVAADNNNSINEDASSGVTGNVITDNDTIDGVDSDSDNSDTLTISNITYDTTTTAVTGSGNTSTGTYGELSIDEDGGYTYTITDNTSTQALQAGDTLTESFTYEVSDGQGGLDTAVLVITITGSNDAPVITSSTTDAIGSVTEAGNLDDGTVIAGTDTVTGTLTSSDIDNASTATWSVDAVDSVGTYGSLTIDSSTGEWTYTLDNTLAATQGLDEGDSDTETFTVTVTDDQGATVTQDITITVNGTNDTPVAGDDTISVTESTTLTVNAVNGVIGTDSDVDDSAVLSVTSITNGTSTQAVSGGTAGVITTSYGTLTINDDGSYTYVADGADSEVLAKDAMVTDAYTYILTDAQGATTTATLMVTITGANDAPVITSSTTDATGSVTEAGNLDDGTVVAGTVTVTGTLTSSDVDNVSTATWSVDAVDSVGTYGSLTIDSSTGEWTYTLDNTLAATQGLDEGDSDTEIFTVTVTDDQGATVTQDITITVNGTNDTPVAGDDTVSVTESTTLTVNAVNGVIGTDSDVDDSAVLSVTSITNGTSTQAVSGGTAGVITTSYGTLTINDDGSYTYVADGADSEVLAKDAMVTDAYTYILTDAQGATTTATLTVTITGANDAPVITSSTTDAIGSVTEAGNLDDGTAVAGTDTVTGTLTSSDIDNASTATWSGGATGTYGSLAIDSSTGEWTYTLDNTLAATQGLDEGDSDTETFTVTVTDDQGATVTQDITITVNGTNDTPVAGDDTVSVTESTTLTVNAVNGVIGTDSDVDDSAVLSVTSITNGTSTQAVSGGTAGVITTSYGTLTINDDGSYTYVADGADSEVLAKDAMVTDAYTYTLTDAQGATTTATLTVTITGANHSPTVTSLGDQNSEDGTTITSIDVSSAFNDVDTNDTLTYTATNLPTGLSINSSTGIISGTLDSSASQDGVSGAYVVTVTAIDTSNEAISADFTYTVTNPDPVSVDNSNSIDNDEASVTGNVLTNDSDDDVLTVDNTGNKIGSYGTLTLNSDGSYTYVLDDTNATVIALEGNDTLSETFTYTVSDGEGGLAAADLVITIADASAVFVAAPITETEPNHVVTESGNLDDGSLVTGIDNVTGTLTSSVTEILTSSGSTTTLSGNSISTYGSLTIDPSTGEWTYTLDNTLDATQALNEGDSVESIFTITVTDGQGETATQDITITINGTNDISVAVNDSNNVEESATLTVSAANGVIGNDTDVDDSEVLSVTNITDGTTTNAVSSSASGVITTSYGTLTISSDGSYIYIADGVDSEALAEGATATDSFTYTLVDSKGAATTSTLTISISGPVVTETEIIAEDASENSNDISTSNSSSSTDSRLLLSESDFGQDESTVNRVYEGLASINNVGEDSPLRLAIILEDHLVIAEGLQSFELPESAFVHSDPDEEITIEVTLLDGSPLPSYISFDPESGVFEVDATNAQKSDGDQDIVKVIAKDSKGNSATTNFTITYHNESSSEVTEIYAAQDENPLEETIQPQVEQSEQAELTFGLKEQLQTLGEGEFASKKAQLLMDMKQLLG